VKKAKIIIILVTSLLALVVFLQNTEAVETKILFTAVTMPRVVLLIVTFVAGFIVGLATASQVLGSRHKLASPEKKH
jgi:uncharacterized integral membrane protein